MQAKTLKPASMIDRTTAGKMLGLSVRTIDRYIRRGILSAYEQNNRILLNKKEIVQFPQTVMRRKRTQIDTKKEVSTPRRGNHINPHAELHDAGFYRDLYEEAKKSLYDYQQRLQQTQYRIGQLESQALHPLQPHIPQHQAENIPRELLEREVREREKEITTLRESIKRERSARIIFAILTYLMIALLPALWYLLR